MLIRLRLGIIATVCAFLVASALPAEAQRGHGSGSGSRGGASAVPRQAQGPGPSAGARPTHGPGTASGGHPTNGPGYRPGPGYGPRPVAHPGPGYRPGYGYRGHYSGYGYRGYYPWYGYGSYYPWYSSGVYFGFGTYGWPYYYGARPYVSYGYYGAPGDAGYGAGPGGASLKVEVKPKSAEVYVDGNFAGVVDQFDGMFDSLPLDAGEHEITIYKAGFRSIRQRLHLKAGSTQRIKGSMEPLAPGEPNEPRPQAAPSPQQPEQQVQVAPRYQSPQPQYGSPQPQGPPPERPLPEQYPPAAGDSRFGQLAIRVQPSDAEVLIDGEPWRYAAGADRLVVQLAAGTHRVEIRKDGYDSYVSAVEIRRGETVVFNVSLSRF
jgi:hypothetical protein